MSFSYLCHSPPHANSEVTQVLLLMHDKAMVGDLGMQKKVDFIGLGSIHVEMLKIGADTVQNVHPGNLPRQLVDYHSWHTLSVSVDGHNRLLSKIS